MKTRIEFSGYCLGILLGLAIGQGHASAAEFTAGAVVDNTRSNVVSSGWIKSKDGSVIFRLLGSAVPIDKTGPIVVFGEIRNQTNKTISRNRSQVGQ